MTTTSAVVSPLTRARLRRAVADLSDADPDLAAIAKQHGCPPMWARPAGFATLVHIILERRCR